MSEIRVRGSDGCPLNCKGRALDYEPGLLKRPGSFQLRTGAGELPSQVCFLSVHRHDGHGVVLKEVEDAQRFHQNLMERLAGFS